MLFIHYDIYLSNHRYYDTFDDARMALGVARKVRELLKTLL